jgi:hypothetical protein
MAGSWELGEMERWRGAMEEDGVQRVEDAVVEWWW